MHTLFGDKVSNHNLDYSETISVAQASLKLTVIILPQSLGGWMGSKSNPLSLLVFYGDYRSNSLKHALLRKRDWLLEESTGRDSGDTVLPKRMSPDWATVQVMGKPGWGKGKVTSSLELCTKKRYQGEKFSQHNSLTPIGEKETKTPGDDVKFDPKLLAETKLNPDGIKME